MAERDYIQLIKERYGAEHTMENNDHVVRMKGMDGQYRTYRHTSMLCIACRIADDILDDVYCVPILGPKLTEQ